MLHLVRPALTVRTVYDIDLAGLKENGIRGIITDLDNTLVGAKAVYATDELAEWLQEVRSNGFQVVVVSNNNETRVRTFSEPLNLPFVHKARKPLGAAFLRALDIMALKPHEAAVVGDQLMTDVLGGNRIGLCTILVEPIAIAEEGWRTKWINRNLERAFVAKLRKKGWLP